MTTRPSGIKLYVKPFGHWKMTTFLAALRHDGTAPCVFGGPIKGAKFLAFVEQMLVPTLSPGEIVLMDNVFIAKSIGGGKYNDDDAQIRDGQITDYSRRHSDSTLLGD